MGVMYKIEAMLRIVISHFELVVIRFYASYLAVPDVNFIYKHYSIYY